MLVLPGRASSPAARAPLAHLVQAAATCILQVTQVELQHLSLQLAELDARLLHEGSVDLLYLFCGRNGSEQKGQRRSKLLSNPLILLSPPTEPKTSILLEQTRE